MDFRVDLEVFRGPLDLLLYLVRKHEVEITDLPVSLITEQYVRYLDVIEHLDVNAAGDFLEMASTLAEIKSRLVLPHGDEGELELEDPRQELVRQLLEYKQFKDAASMLDERSRAWQEHFPRVAPDAPPQNRDLAHESLQEVELWDLVSALGRVMRDNLGGPTSNIVYDDTPIHVYMSRVHTRLNERGRLAFSDLFERGMHKSRVVGIFLALLELVRHHSVRAEQNELFGEIWLVPGENRREDVDFSGADSYEHQPATNSAEPVVESTAPADVEETTEAPAIEEASTTEPAAEEPDEFPQ
ncbi:MAG: segregation/condensation protein A [Pirellulales bacterium]|nr:segregation/condensation protein A [Pirellulales bacterium]